MNIQDAAVTLLPFNLLVAEPKNVRKKCTQSGLESLADNIAAEGILQNLIVRKLDDGQFAVVGGERRRQALNILVERGKLESTFEVPCLIKEGSITSISLSENIHREAMHPADQFEAWRDMVDSGLTIEEVAIRHGATQRKIEQRLKLGRLSPVVLGAFREGKLDESEAMVFTLSDNHQKQERVLESLEAYNRSAFRIKRAMTEGEIESTDKLAVFVGREAYEKAGGIIRSDLFGDDVFFKDSELLTKLATEYLQEEADKLLAEGWSWIDVDLEYDNRFGDNMRRVYPDKVELSEEDNDALERILKSLDGLAVTKAENEADQDSWVKLNIVKDEINQKKEAYSVADKAMAGGKVCIDYRGKLNVEIGFIRPEDDPVALVHKAQAAKEKEGKPTDCGKALSDDLAAIRLEILRAELVKNPSIASDLFIYHMLVDILTFGYVPSPFDFSALKPSGPRTTSEKGDMGKFVGREEYKKMVSALPMKWFKAKDVIKSFEAFRSLSADEKSKLQAYAAALMLKPQLAGEPETKLTLEYTAELMETRPQDYWTPNEDCFKRMTKGHMFEIAKDVIGDEFIAKHEKSKKGEIAAALGRTFLPPKGAKKERDKSVLERISTWLPLSMRVGK